MSWRCVALGGFFHFVLGPFGPPPSLARFASLESSGKCPFSTKQNGLLCGVGSRVLASGPRPKTVTPEWRRVSVCEPCSDITPGRAATNRKNT